MRKIHLYHAPLVDSGDIIDKNAKRKRRCSEKKYAELGSRRIKVVIL